MSKKAFTLFEIIIAMLVVGILSALAAPKVVDLVNEARRGDELNTVGNVKSGIALTYLGNVTRGITPQYPQNLDNATLAKASPSNPVYDLVLQHGITKSWEKLEQYRYRGPTGQEYEYDPTKGTFEAVAALPPPPPSLITWAYPGTQINAAGTIVTDAFGLTQVLNAPFITSPISMTVTDITLDTIVGTPDTLWEDGVYGGSGYEWAESIQQTSDGGYIIIGGTDSFGAGLTDAYVVKIDSAGNLEWSRTYGGSGDDYAYSIQQTSDKGYIIGGETYSLREAGDAYLTKIDSAGNLQWSNTYGGSGEAWAYSIQQTSDGDYMVTGGIDSSGAGTYDPYVAKIDSAGNLDWSNTYGGSSGGAWAYSIQQTSDEKYIIGGLTSFGAGIQDIYAAKIDSAGNLEWSNTYGGSGWEFGGFIQQTSDEGYIISGTTRSFGAGNLDSYITKIDSAGNLQWSKTYGGSSWENGLIQQTSDGGYIIGGVTDSFGTGGEDSYLTKIDSNGNLEWSKTYGGSGVDSTWSILQASDEGYIMAGSTDSFGEGAYDIYTIKTDQDGNVIP